MAKTAKTKTEGQRLLAKSREDLEWAERMFNESATPEAVDVNRIAGDVRNALETRKVERANGQ